MESVNRRAECRALGGCLAQTARPPQPPHIPCTFGRDWFGNPRTPDPRACAMTNIPVTMSRLRAHAGICLLAALAYSAATPIQAQTNPPPPGRDMGGPPPEALAACTDKAVADVCEMTLPGQDNEVSGRCVATPDNQIACLPGAEGNEVVGCALDGYPILSLRDANGATLTNADLDARHGRPGQVEVVMWIWSRPDRPREILDARYQKGFGQ